MAAITTERRYRVPEWIHLENLAIRILEVHTGVKIRIPKLWLVYNYGKPIGYGDRIIYANPSQYMRYWQSNKWYYEEDYYDYCQYGKDEIFELPTPVLKHQCRIYPGKPFADIIDCSWLHTRQFYRWHPNLHIISPDPDEIFKSQPMLILNGLYDQHGWPYVYITRELMWQFKSYWFYPAVWVFQPAPPVNRYDIFNPNKFPRRKATTKLHYRILDTDYAVQYDTFFDRISYHGFKFRYMAPSGGETIYNISVGDFRQFRHYADFYVALNNAIKKTGNSDLWVEIGDEFIEHYYLDDREVMGCDMNICATNGSLSLISDNVSDCFLGQCDIPEHAIVSVTAEFIQVTDDDGPLLPVPDHAGTETETPPAETSPVEYDWMCKGEIQPKEILLVKIGNPESVKNGGSVFEGMTENMISFYWYRNAQSLSERITVNIPALHTFADIDNLLAAVNNALAANGLRSYFEFRRVGSVTLEDGTELPRFALYANSGRIGPYSSFGLFTYFFMYKVAESYQEIATIFATFADAPLSATLLVNDITFDVPSMTANITGMAYASYGADGQLDLLFPDGTILVQKLADEQKQWHFDITFPLSHLQNSNVFNCILTVTSPQAYTDPDLMIGEPVISTASAAQDIYYEIPPLHDLKIYPDPITAVDDNKLTFMELASTISVFVRGIVKGEDAAVADEVVITAPDGYREKTWLGLNKDHELFFSIDIPAEHFSHGTTAKITITKNIDGETVTFSATATLEVDLTPPNSYIIPCLPMFLLYPHDSYSQFDDASLESLPFRFDIPEAEWKRDYEEKK